MLRGTEVDRGPACRTLGDREAHVGRTPWQRAEGLGLIVQNRRLILDF